MDATTLLADPDAIALEYYISRQDFIVLVVRATQRHPRCPKCDEPSASLHSHYTRNVADLPWHGVTARLELHTRKFRCRNDLCPQKVFCERLPKVVAAYARKTLRLDAALTLIAFALGGEAGARTSQGLKLSVSGDTLLRRIRRARLPPMPLPKVVGVDDWAKRKGTSYGTILVDLERRRPLDLLPDREAVTLAAWLKAHPGIEVIAGDRAGAYADGARQGAPQALQVADRWHLLKNLSEAVERSLQSRHPALSRAAEVVRQAQVAKSTAVIDAGLTTMLSSREDQQIRANRERRLERYNEVRRLHERGTSVVGIAETLKMSPMTVYRYLSAGSFSERARRARRSGGLEPYLAHLHQRFAAGCTNAAQLWREVAERGYTGKPAMVVRYVRKLRVRVGALSESDRQKQLRLKESFATPTPKRAARWLLLEEAKLGDEEQAFVTELRRVSAEVERVGELGREFQQMVKERGAKTFTQWLMCAQQSGIKELAGFADGLKKDRDAVVEALRSEWSNGQTEGQINRLKYLKRQMYGRAKFDLLKARVLHAA